MKRDAEISFNDRNAGSKLVRGEGVRSVHGSPLRRHGLRPGGEKLFVDSDYWGLRRLGGMSIR